MVVERHSKWEPTTKPYDTNWFVEPEPFPDEDSGYNYARIYRYLGQYYEMSRLLENDKIDDETLAKCDVLIIKIPTERYSPEEAAAVTRFVEQGGGLLLIGDHTNYDRSSTAMNDIIRPMGFIFRDDLLFSFGDSPYEQLYVPPAVPHPAVQHVPPMDFAVSCSIDPGHSRGRPVIANTGLWSMGPDYHYRELPPRAQPLPGDARTGRSCKPGRQRYGQGPRHRLRRLDGLLELLRRPAGQVGADARHGRMAQPCQAVARSATVAAPAWPRAAGRRTLDGGLSPIFVPTRTGTVPILPRGVWLVLLAAGTCGWVVASLAVAGVHRWAMPTPECLRPERCVVIDRTTSTVPLSKGPYTRGRWRRIRTAGAMARPARLPHGAQRGLRGFSRRRAGGHLPEPTGVRRVPAAVGAICRRRRQAAGDRLAGKRRFDGQQPALAVRDVDPSRSGLEGQADHGRQAAGGGCGRGVRGRRRAAGRANSTNSRRRRRSATAKDRSWPSASARYGTTRGWARPGCWNRTPRQRDFAMNMPVRPAAIHFSTASPWPAFPLAD